MVIKDRSTKDLVIPRSLGNFNNGGGGEGGVTPEQAAEIASAITESAISEYDAEIQVDLEDIRDAVSANTEAIEGLSGLSADVEALSAATSANTQDIADLSASTADLQDALDATNGNVSELSGATSANTAAIEALSAATSANTEAIAALSGVPADIEALSAQTTANTAQIESLSGLPAEIEALSAATSGLPAEIAELASRYTVITASTSSTQAFWNDLYDTLNGMTEEQRMGVIIYLKDVKVKFANGISNYYDYVMRYIKYTDGVYFSGASTIYKGGGQIGNGCFLTIAFKQNSFVMEQEISTTNFQLRLNNDAGHTVTFNTYDGANNMQFYRSLAQDGSLCYVYFYINATGQVVPAKSVWNDSGNKIIELEYDFSGTTYYGKWSVNDGGNFTNLAWTETPQGGGGAQEYISVDALSDVTNPTEGMLVSVKAHTADTVYTGWTFDATEVDEDFVASIYRGEYNPENPDENKAFSIYHNGEGFHWGWDNADSNTYIGFYKSGDSGVPIRGIYRIFDSHNKITFGFLESGITAVLNNASVTRTTANPSINESVPEKFYYYTGGAWVEKRFVEENIYLNNLSSAECQALAAEIFAYGDPRLVPSYYRFFVKYEDDEVTGWFPAYVAKIESGGAQFVSNAQSRYSSSFHQKSHFLGYDYDSDTYMCKETFSGTIGSMPTDYTVYIDASGTTVGGFDSLGAVLPSENCIHRFVVCWQRGEDTPDWAMVPIKAVWRTVVNDVLTYYWSAEVPINGTLMRGQWHCNEWDWENVTTDSWAAV